MAELMDFEEDLKDEEETGDTKAGEERTTNGRAVKRRSVYDVTMLLSFGKAAAVAMVRVVIIQKDLKDSTYLR